MKSTKVVKKTRSTGGADQYDKPFIPEGRKSFVLVIMKPPYDLSFSDTGLPDPSVFSSLARLLRPSSKTTHRAKGGRRR